MKKIIITLQKEEKNLKIETNTIQQDDVDTMECVIASILLERINNLITEIKEGKY